MAVVRDNEIRLSLDRALKDAVVIWIGGHGMNGRARGDQSLAPVRTRRRTARCTRSSGQLKSARSTRAISWMMAGEVMI